MSSELMDKLLKLRAEFETDTQQVLDYLRQANALLDQALDPATPVSEATRDAALAEALMERFHMICAERTEAASAHDGKILSSDDRFSA